MDDDDIDGEAAESDPDAWVRTPWGIPELVAAGAVVASVGMFLAFAVAVVDGGVRVQGFAYLGVTLGTEWIVYTVPLTLLTLLAAWWAGTGGRPTEDETADVVWRRLRPPILTVAALALPTAAGGIARLVNTVANFSNGGPTRTPELAESAGILVLAVAGAATQWLGARRLLRSAEPQAASETSSTPA
jgi:hypothetical protein